jgi:hypothetical protein
LLDLGFANFYKSTVHPNEVRIQFLREGESIPVQSSGFEASLNRTLLIEQLNISQVSKLLNLPSSTGNIMVECATLHPQESPNPEYVYWLAEDKIKELELQKSKSLDSDSVKNIFQGLTNEDYGVLDQEEVVLQVEDGTDYEGVLKVTLSNGINQI